MDAPKRYVTPSGVTISCDSDPESDPKFTIPQFLHNKMYSGKIEHNKEEVGGGEDDSILDDIEDDIDLHTRELNQKIDQLLQNAEELGMVQNNDCLDFDGGTSYNLDSQAEGDFDLTYQLLEGQRNEDMIQNDRYIDVIDVGSHKSGDQVANDVEETGGVDNFNPEKLYTEISFIPDNEELEIPAVYHHEIRRELLIAANRRGSYTFKQEDGAGEHDETSYFEPQEHWSHVIRDHYPPITFEYKRGKRRDPTYEVQNWYHKGKLVIDFRNKPVMRFLNIPDVLSSRYPGAFMQANEREDSRITHGDFLARMPPRPSTNKSKDTTIFQSLISLNALAARMRRFRLCAGMISWTERLGTDAMVEFLEENLSEDSKKGNTTKGFRDLKPNEQARLLAANLGKYPERSRHKNPEIRNCYMESVKKGLKKLDQYKGEGMVEPDDESEDS